MLFPLSIAQGEPFMQSLSKKQGAPVTQGCGPLPDPAEAVKEHKITVYIPPGGFW